MITPIKRHLVLSLILLFTPAAASAADSAKPIVISAEELHKMIDDGADIVLIDARKAELFKEGHIPTALSIPSDTVNSESLAKVADSMDKKLVFYCADINCPASKIGAAKAIGAGYKYVYEFPGGIADWKAHGYKVE